MTNVILGTRSRICSVVDSRRAPVAVKPRSRSACASSPTLNGAPRSLMVTPARELGPMNSGSRLRKRDSGMRARHSHASSAPTTLLKHVVVSPRSATWRLAVHSQESRSADQCARERATLVYVGIRIIHRAFNCAYQYRQGVAALSTGGKQSVPHRGLAPFCPSVSIWRRCASLGFLLPRIPRPLLVRAQ